MRCGNGGKEKKDQGQQGKKLGAEMKRKWRDCKPVVGDNVRNQRCFSTVRHDGSIASSTLLPSTPAGSSVPSPAVSTRCCSHQFNLPGDRLAFVKRTSSDRHVPRNVWVHIRRIRAETRGRRINLRVVCLSTQRVCGFAAAATQLNTSSENFTVGLHGATFLHTSIHVHNSANVSRAPYKAARIQYTPRLRSPAPGNPHHVRKQTSHSLLGSSRDESPRLVEPSTLKDNKRRTISARKNVRDKGTRYRHVDNRTQPQPLLGDTVTRGAFEGDEVNEDEVDLEEYEPGATV